MNTNTYKACMRGIICVDSLHISLADYHVISNVSSTHRYIDISIPRDGARYQPGRETGRGRRFPWLIPVPSYTMGPSSIPGL